MKKQKKFRELNYEKVYNNIIYWINQYTKNNNIKTLILGLSWWIDSTVTAAICKQIDIPLIWISLPCSTNKHDEKSTASLTWAEFCDSFKEINLQKAFETIEIFCEEWSSIKSTPISQWNIKARLRMLTLYDFASKTWWIVMDTDNLTEHYLGFRTIHGDDWDFNPIWWLRKHEVYGLAKWIKENIYPNSEALDAAIKIIPTDGNWVSNSDTDQIAPWKTYDDIDEILQERVYLDKDKKSSIIKNNFEDKSLNAINTKHWINTVKKVILRSINSEYKRRQRPIIIDINNWDILEKNGNKIDN